MTTVAPSARWSFQELFGQGHGVPHFHLYFHLRWPDGRAAVKIESPEIIIGEPLACEDVACRHTIGFNYTAISIGNVGSGSAELTKAQMQSDAAMAIHPSIEEYQDAWRPHFKPYREKDVSCRFSQKHDPGLLFLRR